MQTKYTIDNKCSHCKRDFEIITEHQGRNFCPVCVESGVPEDYEIARSYYNEGYSWHASKVMAGLADPYTEKD